MERRSLESLSDHDNLEISGSGIIMNLVASLAFILMASRNVVVSSFSVILIVALLALRRKLCIYVLPAISAAFTLVLPFVAIGLPKMIMQPGKGTGEFIHLAATIQSFDMACLYAALVSFLFAATNLLPLGPLDGGQLVLPYLRKWFSGKYVVMYERVTIIFLVLITAISMYDLFFAGIRLIKR